MIITSGAPHGIHVDDAPEAKRISSTDTGKYLDPGHQRWRPWQIHMGDGHRERRPRIHLDDARTSGAVMESTSTMGRGGRPDEIHVDDGHHGQGRGEVDSGGERRFTVPEPASLYR